MDAVYIFRHSPFHDFEIRYSLRSLARHAPYIRKVWVFGDRPRFLSEDTSLIQHVPHEYTARLVGVRTPVTSFFLLMVLASLIPELEFEYLLWSDDHYLLKDYSIRAAQTTRYHADLALAKLSGSRMQGWRLALARTARTLLRLGYPAYNFETHTPHYLTRKMVFEAYSDFHEVIPTDRLARLTGPTAILNHAHKSERMALTRLQDENSMCGFWYMPPRYEEVVEASKGKTFFNFDDLAFGQGIRRFLMDRFPGPSKYERKSSASPGSRGLKRPGRLATDCRLARRLW